VATLLLPWVDGENDLRHAVLDWLDSRGLSILALAQARGLRIPALAGMGAGSESREAALDVLNAVTEGYLATNQNGWEIAIVGGERRLTVGPGQPQDVEVNIVPPAGGGRASYALKVSDGSSRAVVGTVVELDATETELRISESSMEAWGEEPR
jgi:hypothetical protein